MQIIRGLHNLAKHPEIVRCVATIGNYDGVHLAHQQILTRLKIQAKKLQRRALAITFEPHPGKFFSETPKLRLMSLREKLQAFALCEIDTVLVLPFNAQLAAFTPEKFIEEVLIKSLNVTCLMVGDDFHFGTNRTGSCALLKLYGIAVEQVPEFKIKRVRVSSTAVKRALLNDDLALAKDFLGRSYQVSGRVIRGQNLGYAIGFPTANIGLNNRNLPLSGVYAVKVHGVSKKDLFGVANIGFCPTLGKKDKTFEVHILNFNSDLYSQRLTVEFMKKIRNEQKFDSLERLATQIKNDVKVAAQVFKCCPFLS